MFCRNQPVTLSFLHNLLFAFCHMFVLSKKTKIMAPDNLSIANQFSQGNFASVYVHFSDEIEWNVIGNQIVKGRVSVIDFCTQMLVEMASAVLTNDNSIETENQIVIEGKCRYFDAEEKESFVSYCDVYLFENSKIKRITSYCI